MELIHSAPDRASFTPLSEHQSHTPASFYSGTPVLHHHTQNCRVLVLQSELHNSPALEGLIPDGDHGLSNGQGTDVDGDGAGLAHEESADREILIGGIGVWVSSE